MLLPNPPAALSLLAVRELKPELFYAKQGGWYAEQPFASTEQTAFAGWLAVRKGIVPNSTSLEWKNPLKFIPQL